MLRDLGYGNAKVEIAGEDLGWAREAPYDAIVVAAAAPRVPRALTAQLAPGGRLVIPIGDRDVQQVVVATNGPEGLIEEHMGDCRFVPLIGREAFSEAADRQG